MEKAENSIERLIEIKAPVAKVWKALTDAQTFGQWFGAKFQSEFVAGKTTVGMNTSKGFEMEMTFHIKAITPQSYFSYAIEKFLVEKN